MSHNLGSMLAAVDCPRLLVLGDLILDRYTWGEAERVSPEAPVLVLNADDEEIRPGGAASVAALLRGLEAEVVVAGVVGNDAEGRQLTRILAETGADPELVLIDAGRPTTTKHRWLGRTSGRQPQQLFRVDREVRTPISEALQQELIVGIVRKLPDCDGVLISDYAKGVCTPELVGKVLRRCRETDTPVLIDPARIADYSRYRGATLLKPNRTELELATGRGVRGVDEAIPLARQLCRDLGLESVVVTLDREGMVLVPRAGAAEHVPTVPHEVCDVTGAGDMSLAMLGFCLATGISLTDAVRLANVAAGLEVQQLGIVPITRAEITSALQPRNRSTASNKATLEELTSLAVEYRRAGKRIVFTNGCFDLLHAGHVACLEEAAALGDVLIVGINSDASVRRLKGISRPVIPQAERARMVAALRCVDHVVIFDDDTPHLLLQAIRPDVLAKGGTTGDIVGREVVEAWGGIAQRTGILPGLSTTSLLTRLIPVRAMPETLTAGGSPGGCSIPGAWLDGADGISVEPESKLFGSHPDQGMTAR